MANGDVSQYRTNFPTALPGGKRAISRTTPIATGATRVGYALPGSTKKAIEARKRRTKKRTGYAYEPVGRPLPGKSAQQKVAAREKRASNKTARLKAKGAKLFPKTGVNRVRGGSSSSALTPKQQRAIDAELKKSQKAKPPGAVSKAAGRIGTVVAGALSRALVPSSAKGRAARLKQLGQLARNPAVLKAVGAAAAGAAAYHITRQSKLGGKLGDALVSAAYSAADKNEEARLRLFRAAVAKARANGIATSDYVRQLARAYGFSTTGK